MGNKNYRSLAARLSFWIGLLGAIVFISILGANYYHSHNLIDSYIEKLARSNAASTVREIESTINVAASNADALSSIIANTDINDKQVHQAIKSFLGENPDIFGMAVALEPGVSGISSGEFSPYYFRSGDALEYANLARKDYQYLNWNWYTKPKSAGQPVWSEPYIDTGGGNALMTTYSTPILIGKGKQFAGVATADVELSWLNDVVKSLARYTSGQGLIVSGNDIIIAHPDNSLVNQPLQPALKKMNAEQNWEIYRSGKASNSPVYKKISCRTYEGGCWIAIESLGKTGWKIIIVYSADELISEMNDLTVNIAMIAVAGLIMLALVVTLIARYFTRPLALLASASKDIGAGNLETAMPQPQHNDEIGSLTADFSNMRDDLKNHIKELQESTAKRQKLESEIQIAKDIQMSMVPCAGNANIKSDSHQVYSLLRPAKSVGGDLYYFQLSENGLLNFIIGDVSDKGVPAALFMAKTVTLYTQALKDGLSPGQSLTTMNELLVENNDACMFVTTLCGSLDIKTGTLVMANAGHMYPIQKTTNSTSELVIDGATALGLMEGVTYPDISAQLEKNTALIMYTDGISEAFNSSGEQYSEERLISFVDNETDSNAEHLGKTIMADVDQFADVSEQSDDITLMVIFHGNE
jgi:sigma-B regulation protein RsbU (phosphoserine phosphatase)